MGKLCNCVDGHNIERGETNIKYRRKPIYYNDGCNKSRICYWSTINSMYPTEQPKTSKRKGSTIPTINQYIQKIPPQTRRLQNRELPVAGRCRFINILKRWPAGHLNAPSPPLLLSKRTVVLTAGKQQIKGKKSKKKSKKKK